MYSSTIEPRLIALLNNDAASELDTASPSLELPPLHDPNILKASGRPLVLEPDTSKRNGKPTPNPPLTPQHSGLMKSINSDDSLHRVRGARKRPTGIADRALGGSSPQSLKKILGDSTGDGSAPSPSSKKRNMVEGNKDEFVQLPQPPKKQKATKQAVLVPPIIIGLFEPPPQAALFPPIASSSFHDSHGRNSLNTVPTTAKELEDSTKSEDSTNNNGGKKSAGKKSPRKDVRARKKWTEEETNNLLLGVSKHGVGRWVDILEDRSFSFNERSGVDLKDRFRTCCPEELRGKGSKSRNSAKESDNARRGGKQRDSKSSLMSENILIEKDEIGADGDDADNLESGKGRKSRAHRKRLEDLVELGIEGPFRKSQRRERRPFSEQDDREILLGYNIYGPAWTRIQRDSQFHLQSRQPTDLRDRFRNKYPEKFRSDDAAQKDSSKSDSRLTEISIAPQPASTSQQGSSRDLRIHRMISEKERNHSKAQSLHSQAPSLEVKDPFTEHAPESNEGLQPFDWNAGTPFTGSMGEMDISRLLLDESWIDASNGKEKQTFTDINSIISSNTDSQVPSFYNMLVNDDHINMSSSVTLDHDASFG
jgi:hypothetical protein